MAGGGLYGDRCARIRNWPVQFENKFQRSDSNSLLRSRIVQVGSVSTKSVI